MLAASHMRRGGVCVGQQQRGVGPAAATASCCFHHPHHAAPAVRGLETAARACSAAASTSSRCTCGTATSISCPLHAARFSCFGLQQQQQQHRRGASSGRGSVARAAMAEPEAQQQLAPIPSTEGGTLISKTEVAAFIQRDDFMDQIHRWAVIEAGEAGIRNFGLPMNVEPFYNTANPDEPILWGFTVSIFKEGAKLCDLGIMFDQGSAQKHEWVGRGADGFPVMEGRVNNVLGEFFEIWKLDANPVDESLRGTIRAFCTGMVTAINRYYAFGSVFVDDSQ